MCEMGWVALAKYLTEELQPGDHAMLVYEDDDKMWELASTYAKYWLPRADVTPIYTSDTEPMAKRMLDRHGVEVSGLDFLDGSELYSYAAKEDWESTTRCLKGSQGGLVAYLCNVDYELFQDGFKEQCLKLEAQWTRTPDKLSLCPYNGTIFDSKRDHQCLVDLIMLHDVLIFPGVAMRRK